MGQKNEEVSGVEQQVFGLFDKYTELPSELLTSPLMESKKEEITIVSDGTVSSPEELLSSAARYLVLNSLKLTDAKDRITPTNILIEIARQNTDEAKFVKKVIYQRGVRLQNTTDAMEVAYEKARLKIYEVASRFGIADVLFLQSVDSYLDSDSGADGEPSIDWDNINTEAELEEVLKEAAFKK